MVYRSLTEAQGQPNPKYLPVFDATLGMSTWDDDCQEKVILFTLIHETPTLTLPTADRRMHWGSRHRPTQGVSSQSGGQS